MSTWWSWTILERSRPRSLRKKSLGLHPTKMASPVLIKFGTIAMSRSEHPGLSIPLENQKLEHAVLTYSIGNQWMEQSVLTPSNGNQRSEHPVLNISIGNNAIALRSSSTSSCKIFRR